MSWFRKSAPVYETDPQIPLDVCEVVAGPSPRNGAHFEDKPDELVRAGAVQEWTRPISTVADLTTPDAPSSLTVSWDALPPKTAGAYWYREPDAPGARLCVVLELGGRLCVRTPMPDGAKYDAVYLFQREWAGPLPIPEGSRLEELAP